MLNKSSNSNPVQVSYIIVTKNRSHLLQKALQNIRQFITKQDELLIIDGGSTDETKNLVKKSRDIITYFESEKDFGEAHALNKGILNSKGRFIKFLSDDDYIYPDAMKYAISVLVKNPNIDALQCGGEAYTYNKITRKEEILFYEQVFPGIKIAQNLLHVTTYCPCGLGLIVTKRIISRAGLFDTSFRAVDLNYISKLIECKANFKYLNISLYKHINYSHSGENYSNDIHRDEARVYLTHRMWEKVMSVETNVLKSMLGLDHMEKGTQLLRSIKLLDVLRRKKIYLPIIILDFIAKNRKLPSIILNKMVSSKPIPKVAPKPIPPIRDKKFW